MSNRPSILAFILISLLSLVNIYAIRQLTIQDTSVFSTSARLRIPLIKPRPVGMAALYWHPKNDDTSMIAPNEDVHGLAQIRTMGAFIIVTLSLSGLAPNTTHMASLHAGSCAFQGPILYALQSVVADTRGDAMTITTLNVHALTTTQVDINVHEAGMMVAMSSSQCFNSIACGDVRTREATYAAPV